MTKVSEYIDTEARVMSASKIAWISIIAMLLGHTMLNSYVPDLFLNLLGLFITSFFIYFNTLRKNDHFSFLMVLYFCSPFPFFVQSGGGFNLVAFVCVIFYILTRKRLPRDVRNQDNWLKGLLLIFIVSCVLGWLLNYTGRRLDFVYSFFSFWGIILLLVVSSGIAINKERVKIFLKLNIIIIIYSAIVSINKYIGIIDIETSSPLLPIYGEKLSFVEGGGIINNSPSYAEHSMILMILFFIFFIFNKGITSIKKSTFFVAFIVAYINIFMSISRSVFLLSLAGILFVLILQQKFRHVSINKLTGQIVLLILIGFFVSYLIKTFKIDYTLDRMEDIQTRIDRGGGLTIERVIDGSVLNRDVAFALGAQRYASKNSWLIGYGWGTEKDNRRAFYVDPSIKRGSAHSQLFAVLFLFGWLGSIAYWGIISRLLLQSFLVLKKNNIAYLNRVLALFFFVAFCLFIVNEIKLDSISVPTYFAVTIIWMGLAFSNINSLHHDPTSVAPSGPRCL